MPSSQPEKEKRKKKGATMPGALLRGRKRKKNRLYAMQKGKAFSIKKKKRLLSFWKGRLWKEGGAKSKIEFHSQGKLKVNTPKKRQKGKKVPCNAFGGENNTRGSFSLEGGKNRKVNLASAREKERERVPIAWARKEGLRRKISQQQL